jgi:hypothetical protein
MLGIVSRRETEAAPELEVAVVGDGACAADGAPTTVDAVADDRPEAAVAAPLPETETVSVWRTEDRSVAEVGRRSAAGGTRGSSGDISTPVRTGSALNARLCGGSTPPLGGAARRGSATSENAVVVGPADRDREDCLRLSRAKFSVR